MRVLIIPSWFPRREDDFVGSYFLEQAGALQGTGVDTSVLVLDFYGWRQLTQLWGPKQRGGWGSWNGVSVMRHRSPAIYSPSPRLMANRWQQQSLRVVEGHFEQVGRPDVIVAHSLFYAGFAASAIGEKYDIPYVLVEHSSRFYRGLVRKSEHPGLKRVSEGARVRLAVSADLIARLTGTLGCDDWGLLPNSVDSRFLEAPLATPAQDIFSFIAVGSLVRHKRFDLLIDAFQSAFRERREVRLRIVGSGPEYSHLKELIRSFGVERQVILTGAKSRSELLDELRASSALVHASAYETFGVVLIEAMAMGLPIVATASGGPSEIVTSDVGYLVPPGDKAALVSALISAVNDRARFDPERIREACRNRYSQKVLTGRLTSVLRKASGSDDAAQ